MAHQNLARRIIIEIAVTLGNILDAALIQMKILTYYV